MKKMLQSLRDRHGFRFEILLLSDGANGMPVAHHRVIVERTEDEAGESRGI
jgi:hypothetical protein